MAKRRRKPGPVARKKKERVWSTWIAKILLGTSLFAVALLSGLIDRRVVLPHCAYSVATGVVSNRHIDGLLIHAWSEYAVRDMQGNEHPLAKSSVRNCSEVCRILKKESTGASTSAEFCGPFLTFLSVNHVPVYTARPPTQARLDEQAVFARKAGYFALGYLLAVLAGWTFYVLKKYGKQGRIRG